MNGLVLLHKYLYELACLVSDNKDLNKPIKPNAITGLDSWKKLTRFSNENPYLHSDICGLLSAKYSSRANFIFNIIDKPNEIGVVFSDMELGEEVKLSIEVEGSTPKAAHTEIVNRVKNINWLNQLVYNKTEEIVRSVFQNFNIQELSEKEIPNVCFALDIPEMLQFELLSNLAKCKDMQEVVK